MDRAPRRKWNFMSALAQFSSSNAAAEKELLQDFKKSIRDKVVLDLTLSYKHQITCRWFSLNKVLFLLVDFHNVTNLYGKYFDNANVLKAWIDSYSNICNLVQKISFNGQVKDDDKPLPLYHKLGWSLDSLKMLLQMRHAFVFLPYVALRWTHYGGNNKHDLAIFLKAVTSAHLIDDAIEQELNHFITADFQLILYSVSKDCAMETIDAINEHRDEVESSKWNLLQSVRDRLCNVVPNYRQVKPPKPPITYDEFKNPNFYKI